MSKNTTYELKLEGEAEVLAFLEEHLPDTYDTIAKANAKRRAVRELFDGVVQVDIVSVRRIPARTRRRVLRM